MGRPPRRGLPGRLTLPGPTTFHLVRHAAHGLLPHTLAGRMPGVPLSLDGHAQVPRLAACFADQPIAAVITSPVQRAHETAAPIAARLGLELQTDPAFTEIDFGDWTGQRFDHLAPDPAWQAWNRLRALARCPGGESMAEAQSRALGAIHKLRRAHPDRTLVIVSHADILKSILAPALGLSLDLLHRLTLDPACISTLTLFDTDLRIDRINVPPG